LFELFRKVDLTVLPEMLVPRHQSSYVCILPKVQHS